MSSYMISQFYYDIMVLYDVIYIYIYDIFYMISYMISTTSYMISAMLFERASQIQRLWYHVRFHVLYVWYLFAAAHQQVPRSPRRRALMQSMTARETLTLWWIPTKSATLLIKASWPTWTCKKTIEFSLLLKDIPTCMNAAEIELRWLLLLETCHH